MIAKRMERLALGAMRAGRTPMRWVMTSDALGQLRADRALDAPRLVDVNTHGGRDRAFMGIPVEIGRPRDGLAVGLVSLEG